MKKPVLQQILLGLPYLFAGIVAFGAVLDAFSNSISLITPPITYIGTLAILLAWFLTDAILSFRPLRWITRGNQEIRLQRLGWIPKISLVAIALLLWVPRVADFIKTNRDDQFKLPELAVKLINKSEGDVQIQSRGEFVLWFPSGYDDGTPRISGKMEMHSVGKETQNGNMIIVPAKQEQMILVKFLNASAYRKIYEGEHTDLSLIIPRIGGAPLTMGGAIPFSREGLGGGYLPITIEK